jgi:hypothetical protein
VICARCDEPISPDEGYDVLHHDGASGVGAEMYRHKGYCQPVPHQTSQVDPYPGYQPRPRRHR